MTATLRHFHSAAKNFRKKGDFGGHAMFWIFSAALTLLVAVAIFLPIWRARDGARAESSATYDLRVYRDQLREVDRDLERGVIAPEDAQRLHTEIGRKVLDADRRMADAPAPARGGTALWAGVILLVALGGGMAVYLREGAPGVADLPLARRLALAQQAYESRPSQEQAEAQAPAAQAPTVDAEYENLVQKLREAVAKNPQDPEGLSLLATHEARLGNVRAAREAQQRLIEVLGDRASAEQLMRLSALMTEAAGGLITPEAEAVLARSLQTDPTQPQARYMLGILQLQNGRPDRAFPLWRQLLEEGPPDAPWIPPISQSIADLAWLAGQPAYTPPSATAPALPGPDAEAMAAAENMTPEQRREMIGGMVSQLEARLAEQGGSPEEWARLITSLTVLGNADRARAIWDEAQQRFASAPQALATVRAAAQSSGLTE